MVVADQVNALRALGTDPVRKLVAPCCRQPDVPCADGRRRRGRILGGWLIAVFQLQVASRPTGRSVPRGCTAGSVDGPIKPFFLGFVIVSIGCHAGLRTRGGTQGVGRSTTNAVVAASVAVLVVDFRDAPDDRLLMY